MQKFSVHLSQSYQQIVIDFFWQLLFFVEKGRRGLGKDFTKSLTA